MESSKVLAIILLLFPILISNASAASSTTPILESKCGGYCPNPYPKPPIYEPPVTVPTLPLPPIVVPTLPIPPITIPTIPILNPPKEGKPYPYPPKKGEPYPYPPKKGEPSYPYPPKKGEPSYPYPPKKGKPCPPRPGKPATCPIDTLKLGACVDLIGGLVHVGLGDPVVNECCPVLEGLVELEAAVCLCTTLKIRALNLNIYVPLALQLLITCGKTPPPGYTCSL